MILSEFTWWLKNMSNPKCWSMTWVMDNKAGYTKVIWLNRWITESRLYQQVAPKSNELVSRWLRSPMATSQGNCKDKRLWAACQSHGIQGQRPKTWAVTSPRTLGWLARYSLSLDTQNHNSTWTEIWTVASPRTLELNSFSVSIVVSPLHAEPCSRLLKIRGLVCDIPSECWTICAKRSRTQKPCVVCVSIQYKPCVVCEL